MIRAFLFDDPTPALLDHAPVAPDPDLAQRNAARIEAAKRQLGDKYLLARPITRGPVDLGTFNPARKESHE